MMIYLFFSRLLYSSSEICAGLNSIVKDRTRPMSVGSVNHDDHSSVIKRSTYTQIGLLGYHIHQSTWMFIAYTGGLS